MPKFDDKKPVGIFQIILLGTWEISTQTRNELKRGKVHFCKTMHCLPQRLKSMFFEKNSTRAAEQSGLKEKTLILAFEAR